MRHLRRWMMPELGCFLLVWLVILGLFRERGFYDPGALWHVKVGELILSQGFPMTDPFTYTFAGHTWIPQQWGGEIAMALAHTLAGFDGMLLGFATMIALLFTWLFSRLMASGMNVILAIIIMGACLFPGAFHYFIRPHMITIVGMAWLMACIVDYDQRRVGVWRLVGLIPICVIWTNIHGGVLGGVLTLGLAVAWWSARFLWAAFRRENTAVLPIHSWRTLLLLHAIVLTCLLTPFVNPIGMEMLRTWQRIVGSTVLKLVVNEHKPLNLANTPDQLIVGFAFFYSIFLVGVLLKDPRQLRAVWLLPWVWFALTFQGIRQGPLFVIVGAICLSDLWPHTHWHDLLKKYGDSLVTVAKPRQAYWLAPVSACVLLAVGLQLTPISLPLVGRGWARLEPIFVPTDLTDPLRRELAQLQPDERLFNDVNLGGYLIYYFPGQKIFMDDRFELYGDDWTWNYVQMALQEPHRIEDYIARYHCKLVLVGTFPGEESPLANYLNGRPERWQQVAQGRGAALYKRIQ